MGHSYFHAIAADLHSAGATDVLSLIARHWRFTILPQLIDSARVQRRGLLAAETRWFDEHCVISDQEKETAQLTLREFDTFLADNIGVRLTVEGFGLARGARVIDA